MDNKDKITNVDCEVKSCYYNTEDSHCSARRICISSERAKTVEDTACSTFVKK